METPTFLYKPNFCAECGEKIERDRWHFWHSRRFCDNCEPVYRLTRIFPLAFIAVVVGLGGMFFGQMGWREQKTLPVLSTQAALNTVKEKPQPTISQQLPNNQPAVNAANQASNQTGAENIQPTPALRHLNVSNSAAETPEVVYFCGARTQKGTPCSRRVKTQGTRCWQHVGKPMMNNGK